MKEIKTQTVYICPETGKKCRSRAEAERSAAAAIKAKEEAAIAAEQKRLQDQSNAAKKDWVRLNVTNIEDIPKLIKEKAKEFWNLDCEIEVRVSFGNVSNSHGAPIGKKTNWSGSNKDYPTDFLGWSGQVKGNIFNYKKNKNSSDSVNSLLFNNYGNGLGFRGFHTSSGCPGDSGGEYPMNIGFYFFLEDFPKLVESYEVFNTEYQKVLDHKAAVKSLNYQAENYSCIQPDVNELENQIAELQGKRSKLLKKHNQKYQLDNPVSPFIVDPRLEDLKKIFETYSGYGTFENCYDDIYDEN